MKAFQGIWLLIIFFSIEGCSTKGKQAPPEQEVDVNLPTFVTVGGAITETVDALGLGDQVIATDRTSTYPPEMLQLPSIGYRNGIKAEGIISQGADLILAEDDYLTEEVYQQLEDTGMQQHVFQREYTIDGTKKLIREVAEAVGKTNQAQPLIDHINGKMQEVEGLLASHPEKPTVLFVYAHGQSSLQIFGSGTFAKEMVRLAGGQLAVPELENYKALTTEGLIQANPDYILFFDSGLESLGGLEGVLQIPGVMQTNAGKQKQIIALDGLYLSGFGPRVGDAVLELAQLIHPAVNASL